MRTRHTFYTSSCRTTQKREGGRRKVSIHRQSGGKKPLMEKKHEEIIRNLNASDKTFMHSN